MSRVIGVGAGKFSGVRRNFARISPNFPETFLGHFSCKYIFMKTVLGADSSNQSMLGAIFSNQKTLAAIFARIFKTFAQIFMDFAKVFTDFDQIFTKSKLFGVRLHPHFLHHSRESMVGHMLTSFTFPTIYLSLSWISVATTISGVTDRGRVAPSKVNEKLVPLWLRFWYLVFFSLVLFCVFRGVFLASIDIHDIQIFTIISLPFIWVLASGPRMVTSGPFSAKLYPPGSNL